MPRGTAHAADVLSLLTTDKNATFDISVVSQPLSLLEYLEKKLNIPTSTIVQSQDNSEEHNEQVQLLLHRVIVIDNEQAKHSQPLQATNYSTQQHFTQVELVDFAVSRHVRQSAKHTSIPSNVLQLGYRLERPNDGIQWNNNEGLKNPHLGAIQCHFTNSLVSFLKNRTWEALLSRIGSDSMLHLLLHTTLLYPVGSDCFTQLTGPPLHGRIQQVRNNIRAQDGKLLESNSELMSGPIVPVHNCSQTDGCKIDTLSHEKASELSAVSSTTKVSVLQKSLLNLKRQLKNDNIERNKSLYNSKLYPTHLKPDHVLNVPKSKQNVSKTHAKLMVSSIFNMYVELMHSKKPSTKYAASMLPNFELLKRPHSNLPKVLSQLVPAFHQLLENHNKFDYAKAFKRCTRVKVQQRYFVGKQECESIAPRAQNIQSFNTSQAAHPSKQQILENSNSRQFVTCSDVKPISKPTTAPPCTDSDADVSEDCQESDTSVESKNSHSTSTLQFSDVLGNYTPQSVVTEYLRSVVIQIIPLSLWGSKFNRRIMLRGIRRLVELGRTSTLSIEEVVQGINMSHFGSFQMQGSNKDAIHTEILVLLWVHFLFNQIVLSILSTSFCCTETESYGNRMFYYSKPVWNKFKSMSMRHLDSRGAFQRISPPNAIRILSERLMGYSMLRLLPKRNGYRAICNMSKWCDGERLFSTLKSQITRDPLRDSSRNNSSSNKHSQKSRQTYLQSVNYSLGFAHAVLTYETQKQPNRIGVGVDGLDGIFTRYQTFVKNCKSAASCSGKEHGSKKRKSLKNNMYFVKLDVHKCFDSMIPELVTKITRSALTEREYMISTCTVVYPDSSHGKVRIKRVREALPASAASKCNFVANVTEVVNSAEQRRNISGKLRKSPTHSIFTDGVVHSFVSRNNVMKQIQSISCENLVLDGDRVLLQKLGVPQGSAISTLLCNLYYGDFEAKSLPQRIHDEVQHGITLLIRQVDDYLLMTPNRTTAHAFLQVMNRGSDEYGVTINRRKTMTNLFGVDRHNDSTFSFCGLRFNSLTLEVRADWSRYYGSKLCDIFPTGGRGTDCLVSLISRRLRSTLDVKAHALLLDESINSEANVIFNLIQRFVMCALQFHAQCTSASMSMNSENGLTTVKVYSAMLCCLFDVAQVQAKSLTEGAFPNIGARCKCLTRWKVRLIGAFTFGKVLRRKQSRYRCLLRAVREECIDVPLVSHVRKQSIKKLLRNLERCPYYMDAFLLVDKIDW